MEVTNTMRPAAPSSSIQRATDWVRKWAPLRLVAMSSSKLSSVDSRTSRRWRGPIPALFTSRSRRSVRVRRSATKDSRSAVEEMSLRISSMGDSAGEAERNVPKTQWVFASSSAMARPMPRLAPVTKAAGRSVREFGVDGSGNVFEAEGFDEGLAIDQDRGCFGDATGYAVLEVFLDEGGKP